MFIKDVSLQETELVHLLIPSKLVAFAAPDSTIHPIAIQSLARQAECGERVGVIIGHNRFDLYMLIQLVRHAGFDVEQMLAHIQLSRAFTCHQLHQRVLTLGDEPTRPWRALYVLGVLETFYDESVVYHEATRLLNDTLAKLKQMANAGLPVLITFSMPKQPGREGLAKAVAQVADEYWEFAASAANSSGAPTRLVAPHQLAML